MTLNETDDSKHLLCRVIVHGQDDRLVKLNTTKEQYEFGVLTKVTPEKPYSLENKVLTHGKVPATAICTTGSNKKFYTIQLTQGLHLFTCSQNQLKVHTLDCGLLQKIYKKEDGKMKFGPSNFVTITTTATVAQVGI